MAWFKRTKKGIQTTTKDKKDTPEGLWHKTPSGKIVDNDELCIDCATDVLTQDDTIELISKYL